MRTLDLDQWIVHLHLQARFFLALLTKQVGHDRFVVRYAHAKWYGDGFAPAVVCGCIVTDLCLMDLLPRRMSVRHRTDQRQQQQGRRPPGKALLHGSHDVEAVGRLNLRKSSQQAHDDRRTDSDRRPTDSIHLVGGVLSKIMRYEPRSRTKFTHGNGCRSAKRYRATRVINNEDPHGEQKYAPATNNANRETP